MDVQAIPLPDMPVFDPIVVEIDVPPAEDYGELVAVVDEGIDGVTEEVVIEVPPEEPEPAEPVPLKESDGCDSDSDCEYECPSGTDYDPEC